MSKNCAFVDLPNRGTFWTTQPDPCGTVDACNIECGRPGLSLVTGCVASNDCFVPPCETDACSEPRTFVASSWLRGLAINMLMTDQRRDAKACPMRLSAVNGHWSESYAENGRPFGSSVRYAKSRTTIADILADVKMTISETLQKLVYYKVADAVNVDVSYVGNGLLRVDVSVTDKAGVQGTLTLSANRAANTLSWS